jgi:Holliday junction resolvase
MIWARRVDETQPDIVKALRERGWIVIDTSRVGSGFPDLVVGARGFTLLCECKTEKGKLNDAQEEFHREWLGSPILILRNPVQAVNAVMEETRRLFAA